MSGEPVEVANILQMMKLRIRFIYGKHLAQCLPIIRITQTWTVIMLTREI